MHIILPLQSFYFIRHGETDWNNKNIIMGQTDIELNAQGVLQAHKLHTIFIKNHQFSDIYTSPLKRAKQTAEILNLYFLKPMIIDPAIMERGWGEQEGQPAPDFSLSSLTDNELPHGAEIWAEFEKRVLLATHKILDQKYISPPIIVAHGGVFVVLAKYFGMPQMRAGNCSIYLFESPSNDDIPWSIHDLGDTEESK